MESLSRFVERAGAALAVALVGCAATPEPVALGLERHTRVVLVQSIPRQAYVARSLEYVGVAPVEVEIETDSSGRPLRPVQIKVTDSFSGAWRTEVLNPLHAVPARMLVDLREFTGSGLSWR
jgi:hypothetical protein